MGEKRILIVDANKADVQQIASFCRDFNFRVGAITETQGLIDALKAEPPNLVILSLDLPGENGFGVCKKIRADAALKKLPVILTSAAQSPDPFAQHRKLKDRADAYLYKPIDPDDLIEEIENLIGLPEDDLSSSLTFPGAAAPKPAGAKSASPDLAEKAREVEMLRESYENIKRKLEEAREQNSFLQEELQKKDQRILSLEEEYEGKAVHIEDQIRTIRNRHDADLAEKLKQSETLVVQMEHLTMQMEELRKGLDASERRNHLLEQENIQRENGLKERIKDLLAKVDEEQQMQEELRRQLQGISGKHEENFSQVRQELEMLADEKGKMEQRVIKAYKKIKMDQLRDEKLQKALEIALTILKTNFDT